MGKSVMGKGNLGKHKRASDIQEAFLKDNPDYRLAVGKNHISVVKGNRYGRYSGKRS